MPGILFLTFFLYFPAVLGGDGYSKADFPPDFIFGAATSAYQYEGAVSEDGRTPSFWDTFAHSHRSDGASGDITCDGYHKYKEDIQLMSEMGLEAFRFSISWSRLIPNGRGSINPLAVKYYNNFINELVKHGIEPHVTLFHVDLPQVLEDEYEGWISRKIVKDFTAYADVCFREFGDRVLHWTTVNEANIFTIGGYYQGIMPPGRCSSTSFNVCPKGNSSTEPYIVGHNILLAHSATSRLYRKKYKKTQKGYVGINFYSFGVRPYTDSKEDIAATQRVYEHFVGWLLNPLFFGDYSETIKKSAHPRLPTFTKHESKQIIGSSDFLGMNHYISVSVQDYPVSISTENRDFFSDMAALIKYEGDNDEYEYPLSPWGLYEGLERLKRFYGNPPIYIHENGQRTHRNETLDDVTRVDYLRTYMASLLDAMRNGSNVKGYLVWSMFDCFELLGGFETSFGLYYVDLNDEELRRVPKYSARWFTDFLKGNATVKPVERVRFIDKSTLGSQFSR